MLKFSVYIQVNEYNKYKSVTHSTFRMECTKVNVPLGRGHERVNPGMYNNFDVECSTRSGIAVRKNKDSVSRAPLYLKTFTLKRIKTRYSYRRIDVTDRLLMCLN